ncbi:uncharacterized protein LOC127128763 [Lathyrus oleraceus]|uniref:IST1-like protein n=1 Tax=Pisum sativum TaxID=3888 RepID=A0A9D4Y644_PEA|nr:uncharacterized protein LOC127128763 [Pisum sativum]KAI5432453.1 hypothetical protein KIW84_036259 [Pisum sativum]
MGLIGKSFASKLKSITLLAISRIAILKNHRKARASYAHNDISQLLKLGYHDQALIRVEHWIVEQNMLDAFVIIEDFCNVLREKAHILENNKECPIDLKEATCSLIFASSRCGNFPELHKIQEIMTSKFGKEFADQSIKLHKNNGVNSKMIQRLSSRYITMEIKMNAMRKYASEIGVTLPFKKDTTLTNKEKLNAGQGQNKLETKNYSSVESVDEHEEDTQHDPDQNVTQDKNLFDVNEEQRRNKNAAEAVLQALELATFEISKYSNHKQKGAVISKRNYSIDLKDESQICQNPREGVITQENARILVSKENANRESDMVGELSSYKSLDEDEDNDHKSEYDEARENEDLSKEKTYPSSQAIRWNPHRSQTNVDVNFMVRRHVNKMQAHHQHLDWKMMSVRTR